MLIPKIFENVVPRIIISFTFIVSAISQSTAGIDEWTSIGPPGLWARAIAIDPENPNIVYLGSAYSNDGIYKTTNGGVQWRKINKGLTDLSIQCIVINPHNTDVLYASTSDGGVFKSMDGGENWTAKNNGLYSIGGDRLVQCLAIDHEDPDRLYAGHDMFALYRTTNGGNSWEETDVEGIFTRDIAIDPVVPDIIYAGTAFQPEGSSHLGGVVKSTDGGDTWRNMNSGLHGSSILTIHDVAIDPNETETIYIGATTSGGGYNSVYKSTDGGESWMNINNNMNTVFTRSIALDPINSGIIYAASEEYLEVLGGLYKSTDSGQSWSQIEDGLTTDCMYKIAINHVNPSILYLGTLHGGIFKTTNSGESWIDITDDSIMKANSVRKIAIDPQNTSIIYASAHRGLYKTTDRGLTWTRLQGGLPRFFRPNIITIDPFNTRNVFLGTIGSHFFKSATSGESWVEIHNEEN